MADEPMVERRVHPCYMEQDIRDIRAKVFNGMAGEIMVAVNGVLKEMGKKVGRTQTLVIGILVSILLGLVTFITVNRVEANAALVRDSDITTTLKLMAQKLEFDEQLLGIGKGARP